MSLTTSRTIGFIPTSDAEAARVFYNDVLGITFVADDQFALIFRVGPEPGTMLRVVRAPGFTPAPFTIFGWEVDDIQAAVNDLNKRGIKFLRFGFFEQDEQGVWSSPDGSRIAWFKDPDGNTLSISQHNSISA